MQKGLEDKDDDSVLKQHITFTVQFLNAKQGLNILHLLPLF